MNIQYPVSEILKCVQDINEPEKKNYKNENKTFILNYTDNMKKITKETQGTFGETIEIEEMVEDETEFDNAEPFEIDEIRKIEDSEIKKDNSVKRDILILKNEFVDKPTAQTTNSNQEDLNLKKISELNEQISKLNERNTLLENDLNQISKALSQQTGDKEFQTKLEFLYKQQNIIKDYENQITKLKEQNHLLEQKFELPPSWLTGDLIYNNIPQQEDSTKPPELLTHEEYNEETKTKSKIIYEQQNILKGYQDQISKLKEENNLLQQNIEIKNNLVRNSEQAAEQGNDKTKIEDMTRRIKYYQDDNLRLSNEVVKLSSKLENTKHQLEHFEKNKAKLMSQLVNLNNIISENNVIENPFNTIISKVEDKPETDKKNSSEKQISQDRFQQTIIPKKIENIEGFNLQTEEIFKKK